MFEITRLCQSCRRWRAPAPPMNEVREFVCWDCNPFGEWIPQHRATILKAHPDWIPPQLQISLNPIYEKDVHKVS